MRTPWHLWLIGILSLVWNGVGAMDYLMTQIDYEPYMSQFSEVELAYFKSFPEWVVASWAVAVWTSVLGSLLLLLRMRLASVLLGVSLIAMILTFIHNFALADVAMSHVVGKEALWFSAAIIVVAVLLWVYARTMQRRGVLR